MIDRKQIEELVRKKLLTLLKDQKPAQPLNFVNEERVLASGKNSTLWITPKAIITPIARDTAEQLNIRFESSAGVSVPDIDQITPQTIVIGSDHGGFSLKELLKTELKNWGYPVLDVGTHSEAAVDYPDFAYAVAVAVGRGYCKRGIIVDGAGIGSAMVANKVYGVRAANCNDLFSVKNSREHNNANVLTLGSRLIGVGLATEIVRVWLETPFAGGRHLNRVEKISKIEEQEIKCRS